YCGGEAMKALLLAAALGVGVLSLAPAHADASWLSQALHARYDPYPYGGYYAPPACDYSAPTYVYPRYDYYYAPPAHYYSAPYYRPGVSFYWGGGHRYYGHWGGHYGGWHGGHGGHRHR